ncbi:cation diffusion facilitator family transporter [Candidatus Palauibacter sp.]|uniref:cation diffusion facilitator family transporter n=1 Tax=Candidatus Palauibacter sp. TaxID=3101350 RepID=UPI003B01B8B6
MFGAHDHSEELRNASKRDLTIALVIIASFMFVEVIGGILSGSLALIADAGHMLTDAASIGLALFAVHFATRAASVERTFGYHRLEILAALINALTLWLISAWVIFEAYHRFREIPEVEGGLMLIIGVLGLLANLAAAWVLHRSAKHSVNVEGALAHVIADILGSVAVIVSGVLVWAFGWYISDPILSVLIGILILLSTWRLLAKVVHVLLEGTPEHVDVYNLCHQIEDLEGVTVIHDVHVWTLAPGYDALTAHVLVDPEHERDSAKLLREIQEIAYNKFNIQHITVQVESSAAHCNEDHHVDHLVATARPH